MARVDAPGYGTAGASGDPADMTKGDDAIVGEEGQNRLALLEERALSVAELAKRFEMGLLSGDGTDEDDSGKLQGRHLIMDLLEHAKELRGRVVGRNADECDEVTEGLGELLGQWDRRENKIERTVREANKALWEFRQLASELKKSGEMEVGEDYYHRRSTALQKELQEQVGPLKEVNRALQLRIDSHEEETNALRAELETAKETLLGPSSADDRLELEIAKRLELQKEVAGLQSTVGSLEAEGRQLREEAAKARADAKKAAADSAAAASRDRKASAAAAAPPNPPINADPDHSSGIGPGGYQILGRPVLGGTLRVADVNGDAPTGGLQWSRVFPDSTTRAIAGACRTQYSPDPMDVECVLSCTIGPKGQEKVTAATKTGVVLMQGISDKVETHFSNGTAVFNVVIVQLNGEVQSRKGMFQLCVSGSGVEVLSSSGKPKFKAPYAANMQVCGARGGGDAASHGVYLCLQPNLALMLACENAYDRNVCIMLIRRFAGKVGVVLGGPKDDVTAQAKAAR